MNRPPLTYGWILLGCVLFGAVAYAAVIFVGWLIVSWISAAHAASLPEAAGVVADVVTQQVEQLVSGALCVLAFGVSLAMYFAGARND